jgi:hypothetical protein
VPRNVEVINVALSAQAGRATLSMPKNRKGNGVTELAGIGRDTAAGGIAIEVETKRLDDFAIGRCSFIKIDVEGHEEEVLDGAAALIARERPALLVELVEDFNPGAVARLAARFAALSYDCFFLSQGRLKPVADFDVARDQSPAAAEYIVNFLFVPAEGRARVRALLA